MRVRRERGKYGVKWDVARGCEVVVVADGKRDDESRDEKRRTERADGRRKRRK